MIPQTDWVWVKKHLLKAERLAGEEKSNLRKIADECIENARSLVTPNAVIAEKKIISRSEDSIKIEGDIKFSGRQFCGYLNGFDHLHLFIVTIGDALERKATALMNEGEQLKGYLLDRAGSFAVESMAENMEKDLAEMHEKLNKVISMRLSPGYCDWPIEEQMMLNKALDFSKAGVMLTKSCVMVPKKSISAVIGAGAIAGAPSKRKSQCVICDKKESCDYRREV